MSFSKSTADLSIISKITGSADNNYGLTEAQMKAKFDEGSVILQEDVNRLVDELGERSAASKVGYDSENYETVAEAIDGILAAGTGTIPPDGTITAEKLATNSVTSAKLDADMFNAVFGAKVKLVKLDLDNPTSVTENTPVSSYVTEDKNKYFDLGFTPSAAIIFGIGEMREYNTTTTRIVYDTYFTIGQSYRRESSDYDYYNRVDFGGICFKGQECIGKYTNQYCFKIETDKTGVTLHSYRYYREVSSAENLDLVFLNDSGSSAKFKGDIYCLAIA